MKITKFVHSCLLVEMPEPVNRTVLFDPGAMSVDALDIDALEFLDDIIITHNHPDHLDVDLVKRLIAKFPDVRLTGPQQVAAQLGPKGITVMVQPSDGITFFDVPHEIIRPYFDADPPEEIGVHYLDILTDPGDSHSFTETKAILALPVQAPWGSANNAVKLALGLKPKHILPIHDWHWSEAARSGAYDSMEKLFAAQGITFHKLETGVPVVIDL